MSSDWQSSREHWRKRAEKAERTVERLAPRRDCLEGAKQTVDIVATTLSEADNIKGARLYLRGLISERQDLLELALCQFDAALRGEEPPTSVPVQADAGSATAKPGRGSAPVDQEPRLGGGDKGTV